MYELTELARISILYKVFFVSDPQTGSGAYRISGGNNGAKYVAGGLGFLFGLFLMFNPTFVVTELAILALVVAVSFVYHAITIELVLSDKHGAATALDFASLFLGGMSIALGIPAVATAAGVSGMVSVYLAIMTFILSMVAWGPDYE